MEFLTEYEAPNYAVKTGIFDAKGEELSFERSPITRETKDQFMSIKTKAQAKKFFLEHGPLFFNAPLYAHDAPSDKDVKDHHAELILDAANIMADVYQIASLANSKPPMESIKALDELGVQVRGNEGPAISDTEKMQEVQAVWTPQLNDFYRGWLLQEGPLFEEAAKSENEAEVSFSVFCKRAGNDHDIARALRELVDVIVAKHLKDARITYEHGGVTMYPGSVATALWYHVASDIGQSKISHCAYCGRPIVVHKQSNPSMNEKKFCNDSCRVQHSQKKHRQQIAGQTKQPLNKVD